MASIQSATSRSIRPFQSSEEYVVAMKEDLAEWMNQLYGLDTGLQHLMHDLETGCLLCLHANNVSRLARDFCRDYPHLKAPIALPQAGVTYAAAAQPGSFLARDNVSNFIQWCRKELQIKDVLMFETEDLVLRKNEKNVVLCLLEVARRASKLGMLAPVLIQMEEEIEDEIREEMDLPTAIVPPKPKPQKQLCDFKNLDEMVRHLVSRCTCPDQFPMVKVSEGKYQVGDSSTLIFVRILRNHVMVRVGGGWDTLEHYLDKHDPCRCTSLTHKQASRFSSPQRSTMPMHEIKARLPPRTEQPNKPQTALILSRSQSPMPPVEWRIPAPNAPSLRSHNAALRPPSPDVPTTSGVNSAKRNLWDKSEPRQIFQTRQRDGLSSPYRMTTSVDSGKANSNFTAAARTGREKIRTLPIASKPNSAAQESKRIVVPATENKNVPRQPGFSQLLESKLSRTWINNQRADYKIDQSISDVNKQSTRALSQAHKPALETSSVISKGHSPAPGQQCRLSVTPGAERKSERDQTTLQLLAPSTAGQESCWQESKSTRKQAPNGSKKPNSQRSPIRSVTPDPYSLNNKGVNNACLFTPVSIKPAQESELDRSFEDEIVSNMKALEMCLIEESEPNMCSSAARLATSPKQKEAQRSSATCSSQFSISPFQPAANHDHHTEASSPPVKPAQSGGRFSDPVTELASGPPSLSHVDTQNWVAKSSVEMMPPDSSAELQQPCLSYMESSTALDQRGNDVGSTCDQKSHTLKGAVRRDVAVSRNEMTALELNSISTNEWSDTNSSFDWPGPPCTPHRVRVQQGRQKRSLRKPERVPSIYKLKLRPKIRPRRDNRPEKKPSRIPTPLSYREEDKILKSTSKSGSPHLSLKANRKVVSSKIQGKQKSSLYLTQTKDPGSEEDSWPSQHVNTAQDRTAEKQSITEDVGRGNEEKESWV